jgi:hypothetical protein
MVWQEAIVNGMELREGKGNVYEVRMPCFGLERDLNFSTAASTG